MRYIRPESIEPRTAPNVGVRTPDDWPYGPNIDGDTRVAMVEWAARHGLRLSQARSMSSRRWIAGPGCTEAVQRQPDSWEDHITRWTRGGRPAVVVAQPYEHADPELAREFADAHGLGITIDKNGGWYGHGSIFIAIYRVDVIGTVTV